MIKWSIQVFPVKSLKTYRKNPRQLSKNQYEHLKNSISKYGLADKPIINQDKVIIGGHQRVRIAKDLGYQNIECWYPDRLLTEEEVEEFNIRLNKNSGAFDYDILANEFEPLDLLAWGFSEEELVGKFSDVEEVEEPAEKNKKKGKKETSCPACGYEL